MFTSTQVKKLPQQIWLRRVQLCSYTEVTKPRGHLVSSLRVGSEDKTMDHYDQCKVSYFYSQIKTSFPTCCYSAEVSILEGIQ